MSLKKGVLKSFNSGDYTATVQLAGSYKVYLEGIAVARKGWLSPDQCLNALPLDGFQAWLKKQRGN